jgi:dTDP-4-amino-4,6-dideoxygalactose transaminase
MNANTPIALSSPDLSGLETYYIAQALALGRLGGGETFSQGASRSLIDSLGCSDVILTTSGTHALELAGLLLDLGPGDTVVLPSFTFASVATAFLRTGAAIRFVDIESETLGIDPKALLEIMDPTVRAIAPVHYAGTAFDLPGVFEVLTLWPEVHLVEDNAHGLFATFEGKALGTFGSLGATSFHTTKNLVTGEGGALLINRAEFSDRAHVLADKGTDRHAFLNGMVDKYTWRDTGSSFVLAEPLAALLVAQMERRNQILSRRAELHNMYVDRLSPEASRGRFSLPGSRLGCEPVRHLFYVLLENEPVRDAVMKDLRSAGIGAAFHYPPLHIAPAASKYVDKFVPCPVAENVSPRLLRLPLHSGLTDSDVAFVAEAFVSALDRHG